MCRHTCQISHAIRSSSTSAQSIASDASQPVGHQLKNKVLRRDQMGVRKQPTDKMYRPQRLGRPELTLALPIHHVRSQQAAPPLAHFCRADLSVEASLQAQAPQQPLSRAAQAENPHLPVCLWSLIRASIETSSHLWDIH